MDFKIIGAWIAVIFAVYLIERLICKLSMYIGYYFSIFACFILCPMGIITFPFIYCYIKKKTGAAHLNDFFKSKDYEIYKQKKNNKSDKSEKSMKTVAETNAKTGTSEINKREVVPEKKVTKKSDVRIISYDQAKSEGLVNAEDLFNNGVMYYEGRIVPKDYNQAAACFEKACELGHAEAMLYLGVMYDFGLGVEKNDEKAIELLLRSAELGNAKAQFIVGNKYFNGNGVAKDIDEALNWYKKSAENGYVDAQVNLGAYYSQGYSANYDEAFKWTKKAAVAGDAEAQYNLGCMYRDRGEPIPSDIATMEIHGPRDEAEQSYMMSQFMVGFERRKELESTKWFKKAAEQGYAKAQFNLAVKYSTGHGVEKDEVEALKWFTKAADNGDAKAQYNVGVCYNNAIGTERNEALASKYFRMAADQGYMPNER